MTYILDWEWSGPGDRLGDLASFCTLSEQDIEGENRILAKYLEKERPSKLDHARLHLWRIWFTLRFGLWSLYKAKSKYFINRDASQITEDDDYERFSDGYIKTFISMLNEPNTDQHMCVLREKLDSIMNEDHRELRKNVRAEKYARSYDYTMFKSKYRDN